jgi:uncharacterized protein (TIGR02677 family)
VSAALDSPGEEAEGAGTALPAVAAAPSSQEAARRLFRYITAEEWADYRAIMDVFADTFFSEFAPEDVATRLASAGHPLDVAMVGDRLESLYKWGNLSVSSSIGNPQSLNDYYRRRNRYLITPAGQEVHQIVKGLLSRVDAVTDVSITRLRVLQEALDRLLELDLLSADPERLADAVGAVFDPHEAFTAEITQLFAAINQWQSRYDLSPEELRFFADVLVSYIDERLAQIERMARPIGHRLGALRGRFTILVERASRGLAGHVDAAGLTGSVAVRHRAGTRIQDWAHLCGWFLPGPAGEPSRIQSLTKQAVAAVRTLTLNLTRLSRAGVGSASRRADLLRLAQFLHHATGEDTHRLAAAALGLTRANHYGKPSFDAADPAPVNTSWWDAPRADVPRSIRERGDITPRGRSSPIPDRTAARALLESRRAAERATRGRVELELLDTPRLDGRPVSPLALKRLHEAISRTLVKLGTHGTVAEHTDGRLCCRIERTPGHDTVVQVEGGGTLTLRNLTLTLGPGELQDAG